MKTPEGWAGAQIKQGKLDTRRDPDRRGLRPDAETMMVRPATRLPP
jgi:hypothetical protein